MSCSESSNGGGVEHLVQLRLEARTLLQQRAEHGLYQRHVDQALPFLALRLPDRAQQVLRGRRQIAGAGVKAREVELSLRRAVRVVVDIRDQLPRVNPVRRE